MSDTQPEKENDSQKKKKISRKELAARRKRELARKEMESDLHRDLHLESSKKEIEEQQMQYKNKYAVAGINFFGTLLGLYLLIFGGRYMFNMFFGAGLSMLGLGLTGTGPVLHILCWGGAVISVVRKRSVLDDILERFF